MAYGLFCIHYSLYFFHFSPAMIMSVNMYKEIACRRSEMRVMLIFLCVYFLDTVRLYQGRRNRGGGGGQGPPSFQKTQKVAFFRWQSALCLCKKCCSDCIFDSWMLQSNICESLWLLECGAVKQWEMISLLPAHSFAANRSFQNQKWGWSMTNGKICTVPICKNNCKLL
jgi:hypothetical protein